jgi:HAD superfamily hydrolase (TIGR01509 family)
MSALYPKAVRLSDPPVRAVLLDAGFTLTFWDGARIAAHAALAGVAADPAAVERVERALRIELREREGVPLRTHDDGGKRWVHDMFRRILELAGAPGHGDALDRAAEAILREHLARNVWCRVGAGVREALGRLRAAGLALAVVSNSEGTVEDMLYEVGLGPLFGAIIDSAVVGVAKPDPRIFHLALERLGVSPADAVMVGDSPTADVDGARAAGVRAALLDPFDLYPWITAPRFPDLPSFTNALLGVPL